MIFTRRTVMRTVELEGLGLHSGEPVRVRLIPSDRGIVFHWNGQRVEAKPEQVEDTQLCTRLGPIATIEHLMSALAGLEVTDVDIELTSPEVPALDGSAKDFVDAILAAGGTKALGERHVHGLFKRVFVQEGSAKVAVGPGNGQWRYIFHSKSRYPYDQTFESMSIVEDYPAEVAPARTFGWDEDLVRLHELGLAKGLHYESAVLLTDDESLTPMRFDDEPARHKLLDAIGDLYLSGVPIRLLNFHGEQAGHRANVEAARKLSAWVRFEDA